MGSIQQYLETLGIKNYPNLSTVLSQFKQKSLKRGDFFLEEGKTAKFIVFLTKGKIRHFYNIDGKEYTRWVSLENNFVTAFTSFVRQVPSLEYLECLEDCELLAIDRASFYQLKDNFPEINKLWVQSIEDEMIGYEDRVLQLITADSEKRYLDFLAKYPQHAREVPQKYIASMLGMEPRHLSRVRNKLANKRK